LVAITSIGLRNLGNMRAETYTPYTGHEPPRLFSWHVTTAPGQERGACGVAVERARAVQGVAEAMRALGGTHGVIQICRLSWLGFCYEYGLVVARAELDQVSGTVVWLDLPSDAGGL
jgi:hypothetical protein